ncbi:MAG: hypothetical protein M1549_03425 [Candidatus Dependentiae bacterium]|nr:hypothetical protein [Candidatus Dependentiae bacterium]
MQFETKNCVFDELYDFSHPINLSILAAAVREKIAASRQGDILLEKGADFVAMPLLFLKNTEYRNDFDRTIFDCQALGCDAILVVGIGGSSLGTAAVYEAIGRQESAVPIYFLETLDPDQYADVEKLVRKGGAVHVVIVSKSSTTLETAVNSSFAIDFLRKRRRNWHYYVTLISDMDGPFYDFAGEHEFRWLGIPEVVGGRFSIFSAAALFPLALAGIDIDEVCMGACDELDNFEQEHMDSRAIESARQLYIAYRNGYQVHDTFFWDPGLEALGKWYRQLCAESIGKRTDLGGDVVEVGILPTVSIGTQDLHSMVQLYLGGPRRIVTTFVETEPTTQLSVPDSGWQPAQCVGKDLHEIRQAIIKGVESLYVENRRPFMAIKLAKNAHDIGQWMMMKMLEVISLAALLDVGPFDQPEVEEYKKCVRQLLADVR